MATKCNVCNIRNAKTGSKGSETSPHNDMCNYCWEEGGYENSHSDNNHEGIAAGTFTLANTTFKTQEDLDKYLADQLEIMQGCWICHPELNLAKLPAKASTGGPKKQGVRRPQLNHKGHGHPQTPAARKACKEAFWLHMDANFIKEPTAEQFSTWNHSCDGFGKALPVPAPTKVTPMTVVPRGPKGGVINQLKKGNPASK
jgi:hypothetical protein